MVHGEKLAVKAELREMLMKEAKKPVSKIVRLV